MKYAVLFLCTILSGVLVAQELINVPNQSERYRFILEEEVRFGSVEDEDAYLWNGLQTKILPAPNGGMYVFDHDGSRALLFNARGQFLKQVARQGEGPGELQYMTAVSRAANGHIYITDTPSPGNATTIKCFDADMRFIEAIQTNGLAYRPAALYITPDEQYMAGHFVSFHQPTGGLDHRSGLLRMADRQVVSSYFGSQVPLPSANISDQNMWVDIVAKQTRNRFQYGLVAVGSEGTIYTAMTHKYDILMWQAGETTPYRILKKDYQPKAFTQDDIDTMVDHQYENMSSEAQAIIAKATVKKGYAKADLKVHPPILNLIALENKGVLAVRQADSDTGETSADVFSKDGRYLCKLDVPNSGLSIHAPNRSTPVERMTFHDGKAYTIISDEDGELIAVRYNYTLQKP